MDSDENEVPDIEKVNGINGYKIFISKHQNQLESSGVPNHLWQTLYKKLVNMVSSTFLESKPTVHTMLAIIINKEIRYSQHSLPP